MSDKKRPSIDELEAMLASDDHEITINPDGSITTKPKEKTRTADILEFSRSQPTNY